MYNTRIGDVFEGNLTAETVNDLFIIVTSGDGKTTTQYAEMCIRDSAKTVENGSRLGVGLVDVLDILKSCVGADGQGQSHDQSPVSYTHLS